MLKAITVPLELNHSYITILDFSDVCGIIENTPNVNKSDICNINVTTFGVAWRGVAWQARAAAALTARWSVSRGGG